MRLINRRLCLRFDRIDFFVMVLLYLLTVRSCTRNLERHLASLRANSEWTAGRVAWKIILSTIPNQINLQISYAKIIIIYKRI